MKHIIRLILASHLFALSHTSADTIPPDENFKVDTLVEGLQDPMEFAVHSSGKVFIAERKGALKLYDPDTKKTTVVKQFDVSTRGTKKRKSNNRESGLLGIALDPAFDTNNWIYVYYSPDAQDYHVLSRFDYTKGKLTKEKQVLKVPRHVGNDVCHEAGCIEFGPDGLLYLSTGDNTNPFVSNGYSPADEREDRAWADAQRTAANTNDLRGKILRIKPTIDGGYTIPENNLFKVGTEKTKPEIYIMGCRNPYRMSIDPKTNYLYWGKVGPDAKDNSDRGPKGYDEINQAKQAGNYGWPYFSGDNQPYAKYDFADNEIGALQDASKPINNSPNNTGLDILPPAQPAFQTLPRGCNAAGQVYYADMYPESKDKFPAELDSTLFTYNWNNGKFTAVKISEEGKVEWSKPIFDKHRLVKPNDIEFAVDGSLYVLEYGNEWYNGSDGKVKRIAYTKELIKLKEINEDPRLAGLPIDHTGTTLIGGSTCLACHQVDAKSIGPSYTQIAQKYKTKKDAAIYLAQKIINGSQGVWGEQPMPPNAQFNKEQASQIADAILDAKSTKHKK